MATTMGRSQLLNWLNSLTGLGYNRVEQCASGAAICQVFHSLYPDDINLRRVNFKARLEYEHVQNFKVLQACFRRLHIDKHVEVTRLIKGKYQDNLEFLQWVKAFFDEHAGEEVEEYDGVGVREELGIKYAGGGARGGGRKGGVRRTGVAGRAGRVGRAGEGGKRGVVGGGGVGRGRRMEMRGKENVGGGNGIRGRSRMTLAEKKELEELRVTVDDMKVTVEDLEKERDFYFGKLRDVEILIQTHESENPGAPLDGILATIQSVLYATEEDDEALQVEEGDQEAGVEMEDGVLVDEHGQEILDHGEVIENEEQIAYEDEDVQTQYNEQEELQGGREVYAQ